MGSPASTALRTILVIKIEDSLNEAALSASSQNHLESASWASCDPLKSLLAFRKRHVDNPGDQVNRSGFARRMGEFEVHRSVGNLIKL